MKSAKSKNLYRSLIQTSYDMIKAHGVEIRIESPPAGRVGKEGEETQFIIQLLNTSA